MYHRLFVLVFDTLLSEGSKLIVSIWFIGGYPHCLKILCQACVLRAENEAKECEASVETARLRAEEAERLLQVQVGLFTFASLVLGNQPTRRNAFCSSVERSCPAFSFRKICIEVSRKSYRGVLMVQ